MAKKGKGKNSKGKPAQLLEAPPASPAEAKASVEVEPTPTAKVMPPVKTVLVDKKVYAKELACLQVELVKLQEWVRTRGLKVVVIFEGRDAAGKGGVIKRITESLNPRVCRVVALPAPTEREQTQW